VRLYRQTGARQWSPVPTYLDAAASLAAAPLGLPAAGARLVATDLPPGTPRAERYRLYWTRRNSPARQT
jgi:hypothetical protein